MSAKPYYRIDRDGQGAGGFLAPPAHQAHSYVLRGWASKAVATRYGINGCNSISGINYALADEFDGSAEVKAQAARIIAESAKAVADSAPPSALWVAMVYGYFRNCYSPDGINRNASDCLIWKPKADATVCPTWAKPQHHLAFLTIRQYFPNATPDLDLIKDAGKGYGSYPCTKCGQAVQYEARLDALAVFGQNTADCPQGGQHAR